MDYKISIVRYLYYFSLIGLLILYLFPGSIIGYIFHGDFGKQPSLIKNPFGTSINHFIALFYLSILGLISYLKDTKFKQTLIFLFILSIILELSHFIVPNRSFEVFDLLGNFFGCLVAYIIILIYKKYEKNNFN
jgi:VanZ family protein